MKNERNQPSALIIILPTVYVDHWDECPSDCEPPVDLNMVLAGGTYGHPKLVYSNTTPRYGRVISDDDFFNPGGNNAA